MRLYGQGEALRLLGEGMQITTTTRLYVAVGRSIRRLHVSPTVLIIYNHLPLRVDQQGLND